MNSKKYKDSLYNFREITDLRDMLVSSVHLYSEKDAYLVKRVKGGEYEPIKYRQVLQEVNALGTALIDMGLADTKIAVIGAGLSCGCVRSGRNSPSGQGASAGGNCESFSSFRGECGILFEKAGYAS